MLLFVIEIISLLAVETLIMGLEKINIGSCDLTFLEN